MQSTSDFVTIRGFGTLTRDGDRWVFANAGGKSFSGDQFAKWYGCEDAVVHEGEACTDSSNWYGSSKLQGQRSLWYFFGEDRDGRQVGGSAEIIHEAKVGPAGD